MLFLLSGFLRFNLRFSCSFKFGHFAHINFSDHKLTVPTTNATISTLNSNSAVIVLGDEINSLLSVETLVDDSLKLKAGPELFEAFRSNYPKRREPEL